MTDAAPAPPPAPPPSGDALARLAASLGAAPRRGPPVERWNPPYCGEIDLRIAADGTWFYQGTPIDRPALVRLFASVLRRDPERFVLVTPVERLGITVEDAPFLAVEMAAAGEDGARELAFRTNVDDLVRAGSAHPLRFERGRAEGVTPYLRVRGELWARLTRPLAYDLLELGEVRDHEGAPTFGVAAGGAFFPVAPAAEMEG